MTFIDTRLLEDLEIGFSGGPTWSTRITPLKSGIVRRNIRRTRPIHKFSGSFDNRDETVVATLLDAFNSCRGGAYSFRFKNWLDFEVTDSPFGIGTGGAIEYQLSKRYSFGNQSVDVPIRLPVDNGAFQIYEDGSPISPTVDYATGLVTITAAVDAVLSWDGEYDLPIYFYSDEFLATIEDHKNTTVEVQLIEDLSV